MRTAFALIVVLASTSAMAAGSSAGYEGGGPPDPFLAIVQQYNQSGEVFRILGNCQSSCTLFLGIRNVCIEPDASLLFHAGKNPSTTNLMYDAYNSSLSAFLEEHHALETSAYFTISGTDMIRKFGYRRCLGT